MKADAYMNGVVVTPNPLLYLERALAEAGCDVEGASTMLTKLQVCND